MPLPDDFMWGNSVSSMQYEGAQDGDGKGPSVYALRGAAWEEAVDGYHRFREDNRLMAHMGATCMRFQTSWSRIMPEGAGRVNGEGLAFYEALVDDLIAQNMTPVACLYHFDMPLALAREYGGFASKSVVDAFVAFAKVVIDRLAPKVKWWITFNEQNLFGLPAAFRVAGSATPDDPFYASCEPEVLQIAHNVMVAHARVVNYLHERYHDCKVGVMCAMSPIYPATPDPADVFAAVQADRFRNWLVPDTCAKGHYPSYHEAYLRSRGIELEVNVDELAQIAEARGDFVGVSYYRSMTLSATAIAPETPVCAWCAKGAVENPCLETNEWGWAVDSMGYRLMLSEVYERYGLPVFSLENGIGWRERASADGSPIDDGYRISYHRAHIRALKEAVEIDGARVIGYLGWGLIDIPDSTGDIDKRYGAVYVDYAASGSRHLQRVPKKSYAWFARTFRSNGEEL